MYGVLIRRWMSLVFLITLFGRTAGINAVVNANSEVQKKKLAVVRTKITSIRYSLGTIQTEHNSVTDQLKTIEKKYGGIARTLTELENQTNIQRRRLTEIKIAAGKLRDSVTDQKKVLADQLRSAYAIGRENRIKLVLNQEDPARINRLLVYYQYLNRARMLHLSKFQQELNELARVESEHYHETARLTQLIDRRKHEQAQLVLVRSARSQVLAKLDLELKNKGDQLSQLIKNERQLTELLTSIQRIQDDFPLDEGPSLPFNKLKGRLSWPVKGKLLKRFGTRRKEGSWDGVLIGAREGVSVGAIARGRVAYSDWLRGYGLLIILDHGEGYMTLYAFNQSLYKDVGEWVETGETIASVGSSGGRIQAGLYFGIRKSGEPINPIKWCQKVHGGTTG